MSKEIFYLIYFIAGSLFGILIGIMFRGYEMKEWRCKNCKYWNQENFYYDDFGNCLLMKYALDYDPDDTSKVFFSDVDGHGIYIYVGKNFGCIHWEEKR